MIVETLRRSNERLWVSKARGREKFYKTGREFVLDLLFGMAKLAVKYYESGIVDFPYRYGERQLTSLILPTLSKMCNGVVLSEYPVKRNQHLQRFKEFDDVSGRLDYWCEYRGFSFAVEVKHGWDAVKTDHPSRENIDKWQYMNVQQLGSLKDEIKRNWSDFSTIPLGLHFITSYTYSNTAFSKEEQMEDIKQYRKDIPSLLERLYHDVCRKRPKKTTPDIMACWMPKNEMVFANEYLTMPGLIVMGKIFPPIEH